MVPVVSMGDIAFLLIIFFILVSDFAKDLGLVVKPPVSIDVEELSPGTIFVTIDDQNQIYLDGEPVASAQSLEAMLASRLADRTDTKARTVMFRCDREVQREVFEPVMEAIAEAGGIIAALGEKDGAAGKG